MAGTDRSVTDMLQRPLTEDSRPSRRFPTRARYEISVKRAMRMGRAKRLLRASLERCLNSVAAKMGAMVSKRGPGNFKIRRNGVPLVRVEFKSLYVPIMGVEAKWVTVRKPPRRVQEVLGSRRFRLTGAAPAKKFFKKMIYKAIEMEIRSVMLD